MEPPQATQHATKRPDRRPKRYPFTSYSSHSLRKLALTFDSDKEPARQINKPNVNTFSFEVWPHCLFLTSQTVEKNVPGVVKQKPETIRTMILSKDSRFVFLATNRGFVYKVDITKGAVVRTTFYKNLFP